MNSVYTSRGPRAAPYRGRRFAAGGKITTLFAWTAIFWAFAVCGQADSSGLSVEVVPLAYRVTLTPDLASARFVGTEGIDVQVREPTDTVTLNSSGLEFARVGLAEDSAAKARVHIDDKAETATLQFSRMLAAGRHTVVISYSGTIRSGRSGLFLTGYDTGQGQKQMLATQFEFNAARRMFPCWDEPSMKATFTLSVTLPADYVAISNTSVASKSSAGADADGRPLSKVIFGTTPKMSSYLVVLIAGDLQAVRGRAGTTGVAVWAVAGRERQGKAALQWVEQLLPLYASYLGVTYPLAKLDLVAVPHLGFEAMENWGGITVQDNLLLSDPKAPTAAAVQAMRHLVGHEIAHQWFGDLVTTASWKDVWLNESLAEWMSYKATQLLNPEEEPWLSFHAQKKRAMYSDAGPSKPVADNGFDANISYRKGPAILRMIETYLGEEIFHRGIREYIASHAYGNVTTADLWSSLGKASGMNVAALAGSFTDQPGVPLVEVATRCESGQTVVTLTQRRFTMDYGDAEKLSWQIPVSIGQLGSRRTAPQTVVLGNVPAMLRFEGCIAAIKANLGDVGYYHVRYDEAALRKLTGNYSLLNPADRANLLTDQWSLMQAGDAGIGTYLDLTRHLSREQELVVWTEVADALRRIDAFERGASGRMDFRTYARRLLHPVMLRLGWEPQASDTAGTASLRALIISSLGQFDDPGVIADARRRFAAFLSRSVPLPSGLREPILETVGRHADSRTWDDLHAMAKAAGTDEERRQFYWAMASADDPALIDRTVGLTETNESNKEQFEMLLVTAAQRSDASRVWRDIVRDRQKVLHGNLSGGLLNEIAGHCFDPEIKKELLADAAFTSARSLPGAIRQIDVQSKLRSRILSGVMEWLRTNEPVR